jgi:hypothetical protein
MVSNPGQARKLSKARSLNTQAIREVLQGDLFDAYPQESIAFSFDFSGSRRWRDCSLNLGKGVANFLNLFRRVRGADAGT